MATMILAFVLLGLVIIGMSIGVLMGRKPIKGSCGGVGAALGEKNYECDICGGDPNKCDESKANTSEAKNLAYNASATQEKDVNQSGSK